MMWISKCFPLKNWMFQLAIASGSVTAFGNDLEMTSTCQISFKYFGIWKAHIDWFDRLNSWIQRWSIDKIVDKGNDINAEFSVRENQFQRQSTSKMSVACRVLLILFLSALSRAQNVNINCQFSIVSGDVYSCMIIGVTVVDDENQNFTIGGQHLQERSNNDVGRVHILMSTIPFIISSLFTTFPNIHNFHIMEAGLTRVQTNAFSNAHNLRVVSINGNPMRKIAANAFSGAPNLELLDMLGNQLESIHELAFNGLSAVQQIFGDHNRLRELHHNVFRPLVSLDSLYLANNQLESLDGRLLSNNGNMRRLDIARNQIDAIGRTFLDGIPRLASFNTVGNRCINAFWTIGGVTTIETVRDGLATCFDNFVEPPEDDVKIFTLELIGSMIIYDNAGRELMRLWLWEINFSNFLLSDTRSCVISRLGWKTILS